MGAPPQEERRGVRHRRARRVPAPRACSGRIESQDSQRAVNGRVCLALIRLGAAHAEGILCGYSHAGDCTRGRRGFASRGSRTARHQPKCGSEMGEVLSRDWELRAQAARRERALLRGSDALQRKNGPETQPFRVEIDFNLRLLITQDAIY
jgi:hypothetical protein